MTGPRELLHHGERIVMPPDDLHAEDALGRCAQNRRGDRGRDDRGQPDDRDSSATRARTLTTAATINSGAAIAQPRTSRTCAVRPACAVSACSASRPAACVSAEHAEARPGTATSRPRRRRRSRAQDRARTGTAGGRQSRPADRRGARRRVADDARVQRAERDG